MIVGFVWRVLVVVVFLIVIFYVLYEFKIAFTELITSLREHFEHAKKVVPNQYIVKASEDFCAKLLTLMMVIVLVLVLLAIVLTLVGALLVKCHSKNFFKTLPYFGIDVSGGL